MGKYLFYLFRSFLGLYLIFLGVKGLRDINLNKNIFTNTVELFDNQILAPHNFSVNLRILKQHPIEILYFENLCIIYGGFLMFFGFSLAKSFVTTGFLIEFIFINNIYFYKEEKTAFIFSLYLSLLGGILHIK